jgi:flagellar biosynthesis/type III secretory pathway protein FliH
LFLYERNSDAISTEKTLQNETRREALEEGEAKGLAKGLEKGREEKETSIVLKMWQKLQSLEEIHALTDIPMATIAEILKQNGINI